MKLSIVSILLLMIIPSSAFSESWLIKHDGSGDAPDLVSVMDSLAAGDSVFIDSGHYLFTEHIMTPLEYDSISIIGVNGAENTILDFSGTHFGLFLEGYNCLVNGITVQNAVSAGIIIDWRGDSMIKNCIIRNNGHGISLNFASGSEIIGNLIYANEIGISYSEWSGGITVTNNTIAYHQEGYGVAISFVDGYSGGTVTHNIFYENRLISYWPPMSVVFECNALYHYDRFFNEDYSYEELIDTASCLFLDPQFCGEDPLSSENFYLQSDSPCSAANNPTCGLIGVFGVQCNEVSIEPKSWGQIKKIRGDGR